MKKLIYSSMAVAMLASFAAAQENSPAWAEKGCVAFVNGTGDYDQNCYNSGLLDMTEGKCYTFNTDRNVVPQWINNVASQTWWWVETACVEPPAPPEGPVVKQDKGCIAFENGLGPANYNGKCFNAGLYDMTEGKCYTFIDHSADAPWIANNLWVNNRASDSWWWAETDCEETIYCAEHPETEGCPQTVDCNDPANADKAECKLDCTDPANAADPQCSSQQQQTVDCSDPANANDPQCASQTVVNPCETDINSEECSAFCAENAEDALCARIVDKCIAYKHGVGHYAENCYKSGLNGQVEGTCYVLNPERVDEYKNSLAINGNAFDSFWWVEADCEKTLTPDPAEFDIVEKECVEFENGKGNYAGKCFNAGLYDMTEGKCYELNADRGNPQGHINNRASDAWWWTEVECFTYEPKAEPKAKPEPKVAGKVAVEAAPLSEVKTLRVFDLNGKLLHTETFSGSVQSVDFAKFAGKGMRLVRITAGNKLVATKTVR